MCLFVAMTRCDYKLVDPPHQVHEVVQASSLHPRYAKPTKSSKQKQMQSNRYWRTRGGIPSERGITKLQLHQRKRAVTGLREAKEVSDSQTMMAASSLVKKILRRGLRVRSSVFVARVIRERGERSVPVTDNERNRLALRERKVCIDLNKDQGYRVRQSCQTMRM